MSRIYINEDKKNIEKYITEFISPEEYNNMDDSEREEVLYEKLYESFVTGANTGMYFDDPKDAMNLIIKDQFDTVFVAIINGMYSTEELGNDIFDWDWSKIDVVCRCCALEEAIEEFVNENSTL